MTRRHIWYPWRCQYLYLRPVDILGKQVFCIDQVVRPIFYKRHHVASIVGLVFYIRSVILLLGPSMPTGRLGEMTSQYTWTSHYFGSTLRADHLTMWINPLTPLDYSSLGFDPPCRSGESTLDTLGPAIRRFWPSMLARWVNLLTQLEWPYFRFQPPMPTDTLGPVTFWLRTSMATGQPMNGFIALDDSYNQFMWSTLSANVFAIFYCQLVKIFTNLPIISIIYWLAVTWPLLTGRIRSYPFRQPYTPPSHTPLVSKLQSIKEFGVRYEFN